MTCTFCTGSRYLSDTPSLGPCVCVTPDAMRQLDEQLSELDRELKQALSDVNAAQDHLDTLALKAGDNGEYVDDLLKFTGDIWDAWDDYCVQQGVGADGAWLDKTIRKHRPSFSRLWDRMQEIRRECVSD